MPQDAPAQSQQRFLADPFTLIPAAGGRSELRQQYQRPLLAMLVVVALVLLIACANIANLLLARATARRHESSVRLAIGASRWRIARQLLAESLLVSGIGAGVGLVFAAWSSRALVAQLSTSDTRVFLDLSLDWRVMAFTAAVAAGTAVLFGIAPALRGASGAPIDSLKAQGRTESAEAGGRRSGGLVAAQVALSLVLVVAAGLFVRTFERLATLPLGFDRERVLLVDVNATRASTNSGGGIRLSDRLVEAVASVPGVAAVGASAVTPVSGGRFRLACCRLSASESARAQVRRWYPSLVRRHPRRACPV